MDRLGAILIPRNRQQRTKPGCVIVVMVSDKYCSDLPNVNASFGNTPRDAIAGINDIMRPVHS